MKPLERTGPAYLLSSSFEDIFAAMESLPSKYNNPLCFPDERYGKPELRICFYPALQDFVEDAKKAESEGHLEQFIRERTEIAAATTKVSDVFSMDQEALNLALVGSKREDQFIGSG